MPPAKENPKNKPAQPIEASPEVAANPPSAPVPNHDEIDVAAALARKTQDGKGEQEVPESDFQSFATEGVEDTKNLLSIQQVTEQVLAGTWGPNVNVAGQRLQEAGYDVKAVAEEFARRKAAGAPSAF